MSNKIPKRILVAPLDWGLGHTTRCLPIIGYLKQLEHAVIVACNQWQRSFIENIYSDIEFVMLEGYNISYTAKASLSYINIFSQVPGICASIKKEHTWLAANAATLKIDGIISDNRYGLYHQHIPSVIMTHQAEVQTGMGNRANRILQKMHYRFLAHFNHVWIPDVKGDINLGGRLSHPIQLPANASYIGLLSQFENVAAKSNRDGYLLILLSGPEPQRSILQGILWEQVIHYKGKVVFVAGKECNAPSKIPDHITFYSRIGRAMLADVILGASIVVCRSGYSTVMDLMLLNRGALLIPTPGQTEQEYLASYLSESRFFTAAAQKHIDINQAVNNFRYTNSHHALFADKYLLYREVVANWVSRI